MIKLFPNGQLIIDTLEKIAPRQLAEEWDNVGLMVGNPSQSVKRILVSLDITLEIVEYAVNNQVDMIVAHHPLIFRGIKKIRTDLGIGKTVNLLIKNDILAVAVHTNLDIVSGGVNDVLAEKLKLKKISTLNHNTKEINNGYGFGRVGVLEQPVDINTLLQNIKLSLPTKGIRYVDISPKPIRKIAICGGAGADFIGRAAMMGADAFITGDIKYHEAQKAMELGMYIIDAGHFGTEFPVVKVLADTLRQELNNKKLEVDIIEDDISEDIFNFV